LLRLFFLKISVKVWSRFCRGSRASKKWKSFQSWMKKISIHKTNSRYDQQIRARC
jgi:hypothetical protein